MTTSISPRDRSRRVEDRRRRRGGELQLHLAADVYDHDAAVRIASRLRGRLGIIDNDGRALSPPVRRLIASHPAMVLHTRASAASSSAFTRLGARPTLSP